MKQHVRPRRGRPHPTPLCSLDLEGAMAAMAAGDSQAIFGLAAGYGHRIAPVVRRHLRECGYEHADADEVDALVLDVCISLAEVAHAWHPDGALPWHWARTRVRDVVVRFVGIHADSLDGRDDGSGGLDHLDRLSLVGELDDAEPATYARLVATRRDIALFDEARRLAGIDDADLWCLIRYRMQLDQGDPSPAHTLAPEYGVSPPTLRKRVSRTGHRLRRVVAAHDRFAPLAEFAVAA